MRPCKIEYLRFIQLNLPLLLFNRDAIPLFSLLEIKTHDKVY